MKEEKTTKEFIKISKITSTSIVCKNCEHTYELPPNAVLLLASGIYPHNCDSCGHLKYSRQYAGLNEYMER